MGFAGQGVDSPWAVPNVLLALAVRTFFRLCERGDCHRERARHDVALRQTAALERWEQQSGATPVRGHLSLAATCR